MSPERIAGLQYHFNSDIWSFGITLVELLLGCFPYVQGGGGQVLDMMDLLDRCVMCVAACVMCVAACVSSLSSPHISPLYPLSLSLSLSHTHTHTHAHRMLLAALVLVSSIQTYTCLYTHIHMYVSLLYTCIPACS